MNFNFNESLKTINGQIMKDNDGQGNVVDATFKLVVVNAILSPVQKETGVDKVKKYELARRIFAAENEIDLNEEEIKLIKDRVGELFSPLIVGQIYELLKI